MTGAVLSRINVRLQAEDVERLRSWAAAHRDPDTGRPLSMSGAARELLCQALRAPQPDIPGTDETPATRRDLADAVATILDALPAAAPRLDPSAPTDN